MLRPPADLARSALRTPHRHADDGGPGAAGRSPTPHDGTPLSHAKRPDASLGGGIRPFVRRSQSRSSSSSSSSSISRGLT